ncbi:MAG: TonB-dependent receptor [Nitrospinota bacterium]|jgi:vitamin B12 transporter|nr:TonB-dependent receptor [Nitrospinota bacterium]HJM43833.1 TonB-dependent receptor [Nitrospinota bacterium]
MNRRADIPMKTLHHRTRRLRRNLVFRIAAFCATLWAAAPWGLPSAIAQEEVVLPELVVTATRTPEPLDTTGVSITVLTREDLRATGTDVRDALRLVPGLAVVGGGSRGATTSIFSRGGESDHNLVLIDGVKVNNAGGFFNFSGLTADNIERIEILRGPQSALYGADAMASVIQVFTQKGRGGPTADAYFRGGSFSTFEEGGAIRFGAGGFGFSAAVGRTDTDGILKVNNEYRNTTLSMLADYSAGDRFKAQVSTRYSDSRFNFPTGGAGDRFDTPDPNQLSETERLVLSPRIEVRVLPWWRHVLQIGYDREDRLFDDPADAGVDLFGSFKSSTLEQRVSADYLSHFGPWSLGRAEVRPTLGFAVEHEIFDQRSTTTSFGTSTLTETNLNRTNFAVFSQVQIAVFDRLFITPGVRFTDNEDFGDATSPKVSAAYLIRAWGTKLRAGYSQGTKAPSFIQIFGGSGTVGNLNLKPEKSEGFEVGVDQDLYQKKVRAGLTYFYTRFDDLIAFIGGPGSDFLNVQEVEARGLEASLTVSPGFGLTFQGGYTYTDSEVLDAGGAGSAVFTEGEEVIRRPKHRGSIQAGYRGKRIEGSVSVLLVGESKDVNFSTSPSTRATLDGYGRLDLSLSYRLPWTTQTIRAMKLEVSAQNLLDNDYEEVFGFSAPGATVLGGIRMEFGRRK